MANNDMGSITLVGVEKKVFDGEPDTKYKREYRGLQADVDKLPKDEDLATGSSCLMLDTGKYYEYLSYNQTWYSV